MNLAANIPPKTAVELDLFSGRPNPTWTVSGVDVSRWLNRLPAAERPQREDEPLGYRGIIVHLANDEIRVFNGIAVATAFVLADPERLFEAWLVSTGKNAADPELLEFARQSLR